MMAAGRRPGLPRLEGKKRPIPMKYLLLILPLNVLLLPQDASDRTEEI
jgi:hypothetical protein